MIKFIDLHAQYEAYKTEINNRIQAVLDRNDFIMGKDVFELEEWMSNYTNRIAVAISSGTDALMIPLYAMGLKEGDEIITTPFSFFATAEIIAFLKLTPVFVDINLETCNIDHTKIEAAITSKTKGIISVSLYGQTSDMDAIEAIAKKHNLFHMEDGAQSFGAVYKGKKSCGIAAISTTSFFPTKPLGTIGDGGMMFFEDEQFAKKCRCIVNQGQVVRYQHHEIGVNARFDTIKAAVLMAKLPYFEEELEKRNHIAQRYIKAFVSSKVNLVKQESFTDRSAWAQFTINVRQRSKVQEMLAERGIPTVVHYPQTIYSQPAFKYLGYENICPIAEQISQSILSLPMYPFLSEESQNIIIDNVLDVLDKV
ncbi:MAG: DegT/DnrJ/EryC1/StrS family aminotransferase [Brevinemataceae bacterium]